MGQRPHPVPGRRVLPDGRAAARARTCWRRARCPLGGRTVDLADITVPFLNIIGEKDHIVPPEAVGAAAVARRLRRTSRSCGCRPGTSALIVGRTAQRHNIPAMADWLGRHSEPI